MKNKEGNFVKLLLKGQKKNIVNNIAFFISHGNFISKPLHLKNANYKVIGKKHPPFANNDRFFILIIFKQSKWRICLFVYSSIQIMSLFQESDFCGSCLCTPNRRCVGVNHFRHHHLSFFLKTSDLLLLVINSMHLPEISILTWLVLLVSHSVIFYYLP